MSALRTATQKALEVLEDACGDRCNAEYNPCWQREVAETLRTALAEEALQRLTDVSQEIEAALAEPDIAPVAWMHVPYPGNAISPMLSLSKHREPSIYAASVPLYIKEQP